MQNRRAADRIAFRALEEHIPGTSPRLGDILSFHRAYRACLAESGREYAEAWRNLIRFYLPLTEHLVRQCFSDVWPNSTDGAAALFGRLRANAGERLRVFAGLSEKEFLMFLRDELFALGRERRGEREPLGMTHEQFAALLNEFPHLPREAVVMLSKGYPPERFAIVLHMEDATARGIQEKVNTKLEAAGLSLRLPANLDRLLWQLEQQESTPDCVPVRTFVRIKDGQITWNDKQAADRHLAGCLRCFQHSVTYQELHWFYLDYRPAEASQVEAVAAKIDLESETQRTKLSILGRIFGVAGGQKSSAPQSGTESEPPESE